MIGRAFFQRVGNEEIVKVGYRRNNVLLPTNSSTTRAVSPFFLFRHTPQTSEKEHASGRGDNGDTVVSDVVVGGLGEPGSSGEGRGRVLGVEEPIASGDGTDDGVDGVEEPTASVGNVPASDDGDAAGGVVRDPLQPRSKKRHTAKPLPTHKVHCCELSTRCCVGLGWGQAGVRFIARSLFQP